MGVENVSGGSGSTSDLWGKSWKAERSAQRKRQRIRRVLGSTSITVGGTTIVVAPGKAGLIRAGIAIFLGTATGKAIVDIARQIVAPERETDFGTEEMEREIARWLKEQRVASPKNPKKGLAAPLPFGTERDLIEPLGRWIPLPIPGVQTVPLRDIPRPSRRRTREDPSEDFWSWFERRWRQSPLKFQKLRGRRKRRS